MLFYSFFKTLVGKEVVVELKNDLSVKGILHSVDQYLNIKLNNTSCTDEKRFPHMVSVAPAPPWPISGGPVPRAPIPRDSGTSGDLGAPGRENTGKTGP